LLEWVQSESFGVDCPSFADELVGVRAIESLEPSGEVIGGDEVVEMPNALAVRLIMISLDGRFLEGAHGRVVVSCGHGGHEGRA
jgi:hypothetical protein